MLRAYRYRLDPNRSQQTFLNQCFGSCRFVYNRMLDRKIKAYKEDKTSISYYELCAEMTVLKHQPEFEWLNDIPAQCLQQSLRNMDTAYKNFFRTKQGFPQFKSKHKKQSAKFMANLHVDFDQRRIKLPKVGWIKFYDDGRRFEASIRQVTVSKTPTGKYFASVLIETGADVPAKVGIESDTTIGIDVGIKSFATLSDGCKIDNPKFFESAQKRLAVLQRRVSRKQKGSNRRKAAVLRVARWHERITGKRNNFLHQVTNAILRENQTVVVEDLNIEGMLQNHHLAKSIASVSWSEFIRILEYKCEWQGKNFLKIGRFEPSSRLCTCGYKNTALTLADRTWTCPECGETHDRDVLAACNIKRFGLEKIQSPAERGDEGADSSAMAGGMKRQVNKVTRAA